VRINVNSESGEVLAQRCIYLFTEEMPGLDIEGSVSITDHYLSPEWNPGPNLKQTAILGTELALSPCVDMMISAQNRPVTSIINAYMLTSIREPEKALEKDSSGSGHLSIVQEKFRLSQIDQYISELSNLQFFNNHFMSEESGFATFFLENKAELDRLGLIPQKLSPDERISRQLEAGKSVLSIIMSIRAYRLINNQMVFRGSDSFNYQGGATIVIDGVPKGADVAEIRNINPYEVASIKVSTNISEVMKYSGMESTAGVVIIETRKASGESVEEALGAQVHYSPTQLWDPHYNSKSDIENKLAFPETKIKSKYWKRIINPLL